MKIYIRGGIGDFLQCLPYVLMRPDDEYYIHTHFSKAKEFFNEFGVESPKVFLFKDAAEHDSQVDEILSNCDPKVKTNFMECPRFFYSSLAFSDSIRAQVDSLVSSFKEKKPIIGIHPFGSLFAKNIYEKFNLPIKFIPADVIKNIVSNKFNYFLFGSKQELENYGLTETDNMKFVCFDNVVASLASVKSCSKIIGTDSCFKAMAVIHKIPSYCILGDFEDETRDAMFINQYAEDKVLTVFKYKNFLEQQAEIEKFFTDAQNI